MAKKSTDYNAPVIKIEQGKHQPDFMTITGQSKFVKGHHNFASGDGF